MSVNAAARLLLISARHGLEEKFLDVVICTRFVNLSHREASQE